MEYKLSYKRKLPHFQPQDGILFLTFRVDFPIPSKYLAAYNEYKEKLRIISEKNQDKEKKAVYKKKLFAYTDDLYMDCSSSIDLTDAKVGRIVFDKILSMQDEYYHLYLFTLMSNHVHILLKPSKKEGKAIPVGEILRLIKGSTARSINQLLGMTGMLWHREYYDHWVRSQRELFNIFEYIRNNPVKAGLVSDASDWSWTWINPDYC